MSTLSLSREAYQANRPKAPAQRAAILDYIRARGNATCDEIEEGLGLTHQSASARVHDLMKMGSIVESGGTRKTRSGRHATVWMVPLWVSG